MKGFTLIEMVITVGIIAMLTGAGMVAVVPFRERREVVSDGRSLAVLLRQVQVKARGVEIPADCELSGVSRFSLEYADNSLDYKIYDSSGGVCFSQDDYFVLSASDFVGSGSLSFTVPHGDIGEGDISICGYGTEYKIDIGANGSVSEPIKVEIPSC